jgi:hypothetical protein
LPERPAILTPANQGANAVEGRRPYRFSVFRLLVLTTVVAAALAGARLIPPTAELRVFLGVYLAVLLVWAVLRLPEVSANLRDIRHRRRAILQWRRQLLAESHRSSAAAKAGKGSDRNTLRE